MGTDFHSVDFSWSKCSRCPEPKYRTEVVCLSWPCSGQLADTSLYLFPVRWWGLLHPHAGNLFCSCLTCLAQFFGLWPPATLTLPPSLHLPGSIDLFFPVHFWNGQSQILDNLPAALASALLLYNMAQHAQADICYCWHRASLTLLFPWTTAANGHQHRSLSQQGSSRAVPKARNLKPRWELGLAWGLSFLATPAPGGCLASAAFWDLWMPSNIFLSPDDIPS